MQWINVNDKLPEKYCMCLVYQSGCAWRDSIELVTYNPDDSTGNIGFSIFYFSDVDDITEWVTHWMPLPEPPTIE